MSKDFSEKYFQPLIKKFVSSVLLVDDELSYVKKEPKVTSLVSPVKGQASASSIGSSDIDNADDEVFVPNITKYFSKENYLLTAINPKDYSECSKEDFKDIFFKLAEKADVIILDWEMNLNFVNGISLSGESFTKECIEELDKDNKYRLVYIYTKENIGSINKIPTKSIDIEYYSKENIVNKDFYKTYPELAQQIPMDYLKSNRGLLSSSLIQHLYTLRYSSSSMINSLKNEFDKAIFIHSSLLKDFKSLPDYCSDLVNDTIMSYTQNQSVQNILSSDILKDYLLEKSIIFNFSGSYSMKDTKDLISFVENTNKENPTSEDLWLSKNVIKNYLNDEEVKILKNFSVYTSIMESTILTNLKLGCIVEFEGSYLLCIQPLCDSVRVPKETENNGLIKTKCFAFIKMDIVTDKSGIDLYINSASELLGLKLNYLDLCSYGFNGDTNNLVTIDENNCFTTIDGKKLKYLCCLKPMFAQKIANTFAATISRVGIDQFEWLRIKSQDN